MKRVYVPWWMRIENRLRRAFGMKAVRAMMVDVPGPPSRFAPAFEALPRQADAVRTAEFIEKAPRTALSEKDEADMRAAIRGGRMHMFTSIELAAEKQWCRQHGLKFSVSEMHRRAWARRKKGNTK